jgi:proline iminopeptidase
VAAYPLAEPFAEGFLDVGDGHRIWWDAAGDPNGKPAVVLHGGPGGGSSPARRRWFDPERYLVVSFDQRQCGCSTPSAAEPVVDLSANTTAHLVADLERLRAHLGVERWLVWGGSWGCTLGLAYAQAHPDRVSELVLASVTAGTRAEIEWITRAMGRVFPEAWERFVGALPVSDRDGDLAAAYARLLQDPDPAVHEPAALAWCAWEDTHVATTAGFTHDTRYHDPAFRLCFARLVTHYWSNGCFLADGQLQRDAHRLAGIPGVLVHGRLDISGPLDTAWRLARAWPDAELVVIEAEGHRGGAGASAAIVRALDRFATRRS